ncbi:MAG: SWIM zinc finger family protein [Actinobacteria bacterium]|nr:SWIM zinc finger family protein [Actinomycetota bacterium]
MARRRGSSNRWYEWYPPPSRPRPADGIRARSRRGAIGETWWSRRFIEVLEAFGMGARLTRGRRYARAGQVLDLSVAPGEVTARVQGSRAAPYRVRIGVLTLPEKDWARVEEAMAARAVLLAKLLAGDMPRDIEEAFSACRLTLFPRSARDLTTDCTCPDWANPCKHVAATYYLLAEAFDRDPFLVFRWRGRDRAELLEQLRSRRGGDGQGAVRGSGGDLWAVPRVEARPLADTIEDYWQAGPGLDEVRAHPRAAELPHALLRQLDPFPVELHGRDLAEALVPAYEALASAAERRALGGGAPAGRPVAVSGGRTLRRRAAANPRPAAGKVGGRGR